LFASRHSPGELLAPLGEAGEHGEAYGKLRIEELQAQHDIILGQSDCPGIACGSKFTLAGHPRDDENGEYVIVGVNYRCTAEAYKTTSGPQAGQKRFMCNFTAIPADSVFRPARITLRPRINGPQTAIVVGKAGEEILTRCISVGGSITGEHGVGMEKNEIMDRLFSAETLDMMRNFKRLFDPDNRLNPGKVLPTGKGCMEIRQPALAAHSRVY